MQKVTDLNLKRKKRFSDFAEEPSILDGVKGRMEDILNQEIEIIGCKISPSKYPKNKSGQCLTIQYNDPENNERRVVFTGSDVLIEQIQKYQNQLPFFSTIKKIDKFYCFT